MNVPLKAGSGDEAVIQAFETDLAREFRKFKPELLIISAGFDAHKDDPLGKLGWSSEVLLCGTWTDEIGSGLIISSLSACGEEWGNL